MDVIVTIALGVMVFVAIAQMVTGGLYLVLGQGDEKRRGIKKLATGGLLVLLLVLLAGLPACAPLSPAGRSPAAGFDELSRVGPVQAEPAAVQSMPVPSWAAYPVGQWLNMDWDLWSCPRAKGC